METHVAAGLWWLALLLLLLPYSVCVSLSLCTIGDNDACSLAGVWQLSTDKPHKPTTQQRLLTEMRPSPTDLLQPSLWLRWSVGSDELSDCLFETRVTVSEDRRVENHLAILLRLSLLGSWVIHQWVLILPGISWCFLNAVKRGWGRFTFSFLAYFSVLKLKKIILHWIQFSLRKNLYE